MWNKLRTYAAYVLILFLVSLLVFSAAMPRFSIYLVILCAGELVCILLYRRKDNRQFFCRTLYIGGGNILAFVLQWFSMGRTFAISNIDRLELILLIVLLVGTFYIVFDLVLGLLSKYMQQGQHTQGTKPKAPALLPERSYDLQRLEGLLESHTPLIGVNARWGDGKTFLIDHLCTMSQICDSYEIVRINVLAGNENEIELTLMNEFDQILRQNHIFSLASKQMLKFLESNDILKQFRWLLIENTQSVSTTFLRVLNDLEKLDKKVLIIVDDIERLGDETQIRKVFALMESVSSSKVQIVYLFNSLMLTGFDRNYLEKYIPCYINLTPIRFRSIVRALWNELEMDTTMVSCEDIGNIVEFPKINSTIMQILALDSIGKPHSFRLNNVTVRRVRVFMEEFRDLVRLWDTSGRTAFHVPPDINRGLLLKGLFIKHFLHDDFEQIKIATNLVDSLLFQLNEDAKTFLAEFDQEVPGRVTLFYLFGIRRQVDCGETMQRLMSLVLEDNDNYNRLLALAMLGFDYTDIWNDIQKSGQTAVAAAPQAMNPHDKFMLKAEQTGNEDISNIKRQRNNERIDRAMWNLVANGSSEWANLDAYVKHFQQTVLSVAPANQQKAWKRFSSDAWNGNIYKNNTTQRRFAADAYLSLFQGFRVMNTDAEQWLKLLDFYFRQEKENGISAEMLQNLNYVDMTDHRVYISVLNHVIHCKVIGNLNKEPCMCRFLTHALRPAFSLGYTRSNLFHSLWYLENEVSDPKELLPSEQWAKVTEEFIGQFDKMKHILEYEKQRILNLTWLHSEIDVIIRFIGKCEELSQAKKVLGMRTLHIEVGESISRSHHQEVCDKLRQELQAGMNVGQWLEQVRSLYEKGKLDPSEVKDLNSLVDKLLNDPT